MSFLSPAWLALLALPVLLLAAYVAVQRRCPRYAVRFTELHLLESVAPRRPGRWRHLPTAAFLLALGALAVATARPVAAVEVPRERATVVLAVDTSVSMEATDVAPDRLTAAREAAAAFVERLPDRFNVALVTFDGTARVAVPPTLEHERVVAALGAVTTGPGTAIGDAVAAGLASLRTVPGASGDADDGPGGAEEEPPPARIVLLSDGASTSGRPLAQAAAEAAADDVPVSTIAYGTPTGTIEVDGQTRAVPADAAALATLASTTGGTAYTAESGEELSDVYADIGSSVGTTTEEREVWPWFVGAGLAAAVLAGIGSLVWSPRLP